MNPSQVASHLAELGPRFRSWRITHQLTQAELAKKAGLNPWTVSEFERKGAGTMDTFMRIAIALQVGYRLIEAVPAVESALELRRYKGPTKSAARGRRTRKSAR